MNAGDRLPEPFGRRLDRTRPVGFYFDDRLVEAIAGDTVASALYAAGQRTISRSFKYHRPRGVLTLAGLDGHSLVRVGDAPNQRADLIPVTPGLEVWSQNTFGTLKVDAGRVFDSLAPLLPVGFYYKTFFRPAGAWRFWEPIIRRMAGLGRVAIDGHHTVADTVHRHTDVAIIGAGPAGLAAALEAARAGARVTVIEREPELGGTATFRRLDEAMNTSLAELIAAVDAHPSIDVSTGTTCTGWFADHHLTLLGPDALVNLRARAVVLAAGELDQPAVFANNDLPGIVLGSAAQRLMRHYGVRPGRRAVVFGAEDRAYEIAFDLAEAGVEVATLVDSRDMHAVDPALGERAAAHGIEVRCGQAVVHAHAARAGSVNAVDVGRFDADGRPFGPTTRIDCDTVTVSAGAIPSAQLVCHAGGRLVFDAASGDLPVSLPRPIPGAFLAGRVNGRTDLDSALADGARAGADAARHVGRDADATVSVPATARGRLGPTLFPNPDGHDFIDFDEDLKVGDIRRAVAEGYEDLDLVKRYSTVVMGQSQGKQSALNNLKIASVAAGRDPADVALTTQRPPFFPETIRLLAGRAFDPIRRTPMHDRHVDAGAVMMPAGAWLRPAHYGVDDASAAVAREVAAVRTGVGMIDVSTLGKLDVRGPDAAEFLNRIYTFAYLKQRPGTTRYLLATDETGAIIDDGVACRIDEATFYVTATTTGVDALYRAMLRWLAMWRLDVTVTNVTGAYAAVNVAGPRARDVLAAFGTDVDLAPEAFPYLGYREGMLAGAIPARLLRVGFVGELGYEIHVPAEFGEALWTGLAEAGAEAGIVPFGVEAQRVLRLEKGHLIVGQDTDGLTIPQHAGMDWAVAAKKPFFVGKRAIEAIVARGLSRRLVGFTLPAGGPCPEENHLVIEGGAIAGRVTSVARSDAVGAIIGLAYVPPERATSGCTLTVRLGDGTLVEGTVVDTPFYDASGERQKR